MGAFIAALISFVGLGIWILRRDDVRLKRAAEARQVEALLRSLHTEPQHPPTVILTGGGLWLGLQNRNYLN